MVLETDFTMHSSYYILTKLRGLSPQANYTDRAAVSANFCG